MRSQKIGGTLDLARSLNYEVMESAGGDVQKVKFFYNYYGMFVDMGVGKGTKIGSVKDYTISRRLEGKHGGNQRHAKKWYSKTMYAEVLKLGALMQQQYGKKAVARIIEMPTDFKLNL